LRPDFNVTKVPWIQIRFISRIEQPFNSSFEYMYSLGFFGNDDAAGKIPNYKDNVATPMRYILSK